MLVDSLSSARYRLEIKFGMGFKPLALKILNFMNLITSSFTCSLTFLGTKSQSYQQHPNNCDRFCFRPIKKLVFIATFFLLQLHHKIEYNLIKLLSCINKKRFQNYSSYFFKHIGLRNNHSRLKHTHSKFSPQTSV